MQHFLNVSCNGCFLLIIQGVLNLVGHRAALWRGLENSETCITTKLHVNGLKPVSIAGIVTVLNSRLLGELIHRKKGVTLIILALELNSLHANCAPNALPGYLSLQFERGHRERHLVLSVLVYSQIQRKYPSTNTMMYTVCCT